jgi:hypothetical protein
MVRGRGSSIVGLVVTAVIAVPSMALVVRNMTDNSAPQHDLELTSASGAVTISNSQDGQAILQARPMLPGQEASGTVQLVNTGDGPESLTLDSNDPVDQPGPGGGHLSDRLLLRVYDLSSSSRLVYDGSLTGLHLADLGTWSKGESHTFRFVVTFPDGGANGADNAYQGSAASIGFSWTAGAAGPTEPAPTAPYDQQIAADNPSAYWPLDGSQSTADDAAGNHDAQFSNSVTTAQGAPGGGLASAFDGTSSYAYVPSLPAPTGSYTIEAWVRPADTRDQMILDHGAGAAFGILGGHFVFRQTDVVLTSSATVEAGRWWHLVGEWNRGTRDARFYVDGHLSAETTAPTAPSGSSTFYIGRGSWTSGGSAPSEFFHGDVGQVGYYGSLLTADRIAAHYDSGQATAQSSTPSPPSSAPSDSGSPPSSSPPDSSPPSSDQGTPTTITKTPAKSTCPSVTAQSGKKKPKPKPKHKKPSKKKPSKKKPAPKKTKARAQSQRACVAPTSRTSKSSKK